MPSLFLGLDIGTQFTKVIGLTKKDKFYLENAFYFVTPYLNSPDGSKELDIKALHKEIALHIPPVVLKGAKIGISLPPASITALSVFLPVMTKKELEFAAINEAKQKIIPASSSDHVFACSFLEGQVIAGINKAEVLVVRTENNRIQKLINILQEANLTPELIAPGCAMVSQVLPAEKWHKDENLVFVDIGVSSINISISRNGKLCFVRNVGYGLNDIVTDIARQLGVNEAQARKTILEKGVPKVPFDLKDKIAIAEEIMRQKYEESQQENGSGEPSINTLELRMLWQPHIERVMQELRRSFVYYKDQSQTKRIEFIHFLGGSSSLNNFVEALNDQIGGNCQLMKPFADIAVAKGAKIDLEIANNAMYVNAVGLAIGAARSRVKGFPGINFLPKELKEKEAVARRHFFLMLGGFILVSIVGLVILQVFLSNSALRKRAKTIDFELSRIKRVADKLKDLQQQDKEIGDKFSQIGELKAKRVPFALVLQEVNKATPEDIVLTRVSSKDGLVTIKAKIFADYEAAVERIEEFKNDLQKGIYLVNIEAVPLKLGQIEFMMQGAGEIRITQPKDRFFEIKAELTNK